MFDNNYLSYEKTNINAKNNVELNVEIHAKIMLTKS